MIEKYHFIPTEQRIYALLLDACAKVCFVILVLFFGLYVFEIFKPRLPLHELTYYWQLPLRDYLAQTAQPVGWSWINSMHYGDALNMMSLALLSTVTIICYIRIIPIYLVKKDKWYLAITAAQVIVLLIAASGILRHP